MKQLFISYIILIVFTSEIFAQQNSDQKTHQDGKLPLNKNLVNDVVHFINENNQQ
jgi:hypothetical protein